MEEDNEEYIIGEEEEDENTEDDEDTEDEEEEEDDDDEEDVSVTSPRVNLPDRGIARRAAEVVVEIGESQSNQGGGVSSSNDKMASQESEAQEEWNRSEVDGLYCPICMEAWTNGGDHQICCLPCGHIFGLSCIKRWLQQRRSSAKCPQCNKKCTIKDIRVLYASRLVVVDNELQKKVRSLEGKCTLLGKKISHFSEKEADWRKREADLLLQIQELTKRSKKLESQFGEEQRRFSGSFHGEGCGGQTVLGNSGSPIFARGFSSGFAFQKVFHVEGARCFDVDASSQVLIIAQRLNGMGGNHVLTKMNLVAPNNNENINLPVSTKAVKDLHLLAHNKLALLASLGKKLSVISMESNNTVISYDLPAPAWSCSWDTNNSQYLYAGLQDGRLVAFDLRQTRSPMESISGLSSNPIHTVHSLPLDSGCGSGVRTLLTASSLGLCEWSFEDTAKGPFLVPESQNQGVCISVACCSISGRVVASFRPKVEMSAEFNMSQQLLTPSTSFIEHGVQGCHVVYQRSGRHCYQKLGYSSALVNGTRMAKSAIIYRENHNLLFASADEATQELVLQELPSLNIFQRFKTHRHPIWDVKYARSINSGVLGCLTTDAMCIYGLSQL